MAVDTTFLPKTNGLVFLPRLSARSAKGRVFGPVDGTDNPTGGTDPDGIAATVPGIEGDPFVGETLSAIPPEVTGPVGFVYTGWSFSWLTTASPAELVGTGETYTIQPEDAGKSLVVVASIGATRSINLPSEATPVIDWRLPNPQILTYPAELNLSLGVETYSTVTYSVVYEVQGQIYQFQALDGSYKVCSSKNLSEAFPGSDFRTKLTNDKNNGFASLTITVLDSSGGVPTTGRIRLKDFNEHLNVSRLAFQTFPINFS